MRNLKTTLTFVLLILLVLGGCVHLPEDLDLPDEAAMLRQPDTRLGSLVDPHRSEDASLSGFTLVNTGPHALRARVALIDMTDRSLDAQYYLWRDDFSGRLLAERLLAAAERGVKVRLLVDDIDIRGREFTIASFEAHPNIQVRLYNPSKSRGKGSHLSYGVEWLTYKRLNRRMHNKVFVADNELTIVGGRNIGDRYFGIDAKFNFRDLDLLAAGPIVPEVSHSFDSYWNSRFAFPVSMLSSREPDEAAIVEIKEMLEQTVADGAATIEAVGLNRDLKAELSGDIASMVWGKGSVIFDDPAKVDPSAEASGQSIVTEVLVEATHNAKEKIFAQTAYFVPGKEGKELLAETVDRGIQVTIQTNSLASNNHSIAHTGYMRYRKKILEAGVKLVEVRPDADSREMYMTDHDEKDTLGLHGKSAVFDEDLVYVGTFNLDPRSIALNTEMGLLVESEALARRMLEAYDIDAHPDNGWEVYLDEQGRVRWLEKDEDGTKVYSREPKVSFFRRIETGFFRILPLESQL